MRFSFPDKTARPAFSDAIYVTVDYVDYSILQCPCNQLVMHTWKTWWYMCSMDFEQ